MAESKSASSCAVPEGGTATSIDQPAIVVMVPQTAKAAEFAEIGLGIEEEGVPYRVCRAAEDDALPLAHRAAAESRLGVGIGICRNRAVITTDKLPESRPYLVATLGESPDRDRQVGTNSARIAKRQPLVGYPAPH